MANYSVDSYVTPVGTPEEVASWLEAEIEKVDSSSGIQAVNIIPVGNGSKCVGIIIHDAI